MPEAGLFAGEITQAAPSDGAATLKPKGYQWMEYGNTVEQAYLEIYNKTTDYWDFNATGSAGTIVRYRNCMPSVPDGNGDPGMIEWLADWPVPYVRGKLDSYGIEFTGSNHLEGTRVRAGDAWASTEYLDYRWSGERPFSMAWLLQFDNSGVLEALFYTQQSTANTGTYIRKRADDKLEFALGNGTAFEVCVTDNAIPIASEIMIVVTWNPTTDEQLIYIDGSLAGSNSVVGTIADLQEDSAFPKLGSTHLSANRMTGFVDSFWVFGGEVLTPEEIALLWSDGTPTPFDSVFHSGNGFYFYPGNLYQESELPILNLDLSDPYSMNTTSGAGWDHSYPVVGNNVWRARNRWGGPPNPWIFGGGVTSPFILRTKTGAIAETYGEFTPESYLRWTEEITKDPSYQGQSQYLTYIVVGAAGINPSGLVLNTNGIQVFLNAAEFRCTDGVRNVTDNGGGTDWHVYAVVKDDSTCSLYRDDGSAHTDSDGSFISTPSHTLLTTNGIYEGDLGQILYYEYAMSTSELVAAMNDLKTKWGI